MRLSTAVVRGMLLIGGYYSGFDWVKTVNGADVWVAQPRRRKKMGRSTIAYALGEDIFFRSKYALRDKRNLRHELTHVRQFRKHGLLIAPLYQLESARNGYWNNRFERAARRAERR